MPTEDPEENPSAGRIAGWAIDGLDLGIIGLAWAVIVGVWARRRHRRRA